jgi:F0F1-type ATP synthase membrane subunit a
VEDATYFHVPQALAPPGSHGHWLIPQPLQLDQPLFKMNSGIELLDKTIQPLELKITKFMVLETLIALLLCLFFIVLAQRLKGGKSARGRWWNLLEVFLLFIRDDVARPCIGKHDGDRFVPFLWTMFLFVLCCNLMGMLPWMGSPTATLAATGAQAWPNWVSWVFGRPKFHTWIYLPRWPWCSSR